MACVLYYTQTSNDIRMWLNVILAELNAKQYCWPAVSLRVVYRVAGECVQGHSA